MDSADRPLIRVGLLTEIERQGVVLVRGADRPIAVFGRDGRISAVDNRCPHLGFPAHAPTQWAQLQTADIARRLHRGDNFHEDADEPVE